MVNNKLSHGTDKDEGGWIRMMESEESNKQGNDSLMRLKKTACLAVDVNHWDIFTFL